MRYRGKQTEWQIATERDRGTETGIEKERVLGGVGVGKREKGIDRKYE